MVFKLCLFATLVALVRGGFLAPAPAPLLRAAPLPPPVFAPAPVFRAYPPPPPPPVFAPAPVFRTAPLLPPPAIAAPAPVFRSVLPPPPVVAPAPAVIAKTIDYDPNPQYSYGYTVDDALTGDSKAQFETRSGDVVQGSYSLSDSDGTRRTVDYAADPINGFNAVVRKEPLVLPPPPVGYAAPVVAKFHH
ncbi:larval cuticle protein A2B-like [Agrilus planipennis]|uniref:Larval cuticle protein A2B-like n=1 Tax=Agrilus planipennis TaxID=224129 RepID=A0A1W4X493_AGRPL|nr:larval cuticle protein A2B-like [Agrilus planipennis]XP_025834566.1 larval cuticle protein A2B-like [Agrilus planipennis]